MEKESLPMDMGCAYFIGQFRKARKKVIKTILISSLVFVYVFYLEG